MHRDVVVNWFGLCNICFEQHTWHRVLSALEVCRITSPLQVDVSVTAWPVGVLMNGSFRLAELSKSLADVLS